MACSGSLAARTLRIEKYHLHGLQFVGWNLFVLAGLVMFAVAVTVALHTRRQPARPRPRPREPAAENFDQNLTGD